MVNMDSKMNKSIIKTGDYLKISGLVYSHTFKHFGVKNSLLILVIAINGSVLSGINASLNNIDFVYLNIEKIMFQDVKQEKIKDVLTSSEKIENITDILKTKNLTLSQTKSLKKDKKRLLNKTELIKNINEKTLF